MSADLTVFVISSGEEPLDECLAALERQTCRFRLEQIVGVHPMSAAFQAMPDRCRTKYFVQVDADMILQPTAIEELSRAIRSSSPRTYMISADLTEEGFGVRGNVKCWKRAVFRLFSFRDVRTVDRDLHRRARRLGLRDRPLGQNLGEHKSRSSAFNDYLKAKADIEKWRFLGRPPELYALPLLEDILSAGCEPERLLGTLIGALSWGPRLNRSKDIPFERSLRAELQQLLRSAPALDSAGWTRSRTSQPLRLDFAGAYGAKPGQPDARRTSLARTTLALFGGDEADCDALIQLSST